MPIMIKSYLIKYQNFPCQGYFDGLSKYLKERQSTLAKFQVFK